jgi:transposase
LHERAPWLIIAPLLPNKPRGVSRADYRKVPNGDYWRLRTGSPWADIPDRYGLRRLKNRNGLVVDACWPADGRAERIAALHISSRAPDRPQAIMAGPCRWSDLNVSARQRARSKHAIQISWLTHLIRNFVYLFARRIVVL